MEENEQSQEIVMESVETEYPSHDELVGYKIITTDSLGNPESQAYCTSEDGTTEYKFTYHPDTSENTIQLHDGSTQYLVFSSLEEAEQSGLVATTEEIGELTQEISSDVNQRTFGNEVETIIPVISTQSEPNEVTFADQTAQILSTISNPGNWTSYDDTIEQVIRESEEIVLNGGEHDPLEEAGSSLDKKKVKSERDPMSLPFSYAGQSFNVQSQKLILNVMHFFKTHKRDEFIETIKTPQEKAARVLNVSASVIGKIRKNWKNGKLILPGKKRKMLKRILDRVDASDEQSIRDIIRDFRNQNIVPTIPLILSAARQKINFVGSRTSFRRILHRMGYRYGKVDKKMVMIEPGGGTPNIYAQLTPASNVQHLPQQYPVISSTSSTIPTLIRVLAPARPSNQIQKPNKRPRPPKPPSGPSSISATSGVDPQVNQLEKVQTTTQQLPEIQQFTIPVQAYSHDLPISVSTPLQTQTFQLVHQPK